MKNLETEVLLSSGKNRLRLDWICLACGHNGKSQIWQTHLETEVLLSEGKNRLMGWTVNCRAVSESVCKHKNWNLQGQAANSSCEGSRQEKMALICLKGSLKQISQTWVSWV